jgi:hypothetical protein
MISYCVLAMACRNPNYCPGAPLDNCGDMDASPTVCEQEHAWG